MSTSSCRHSSKSTLVVRRTCKQLRAIANKVAKLKTNNSFLCFSDDNIDVNSRMVFASPKSIQATVTLLENLHIILEKTPQNDIRTEVLPLLFNSFESSTMQIQSAALVAVANVYEYVDEMSIRRMVLPKIKAVFEKNQSDLKIMANVLQCVERILDKLDKSQIIDEVLPMLYEIRLSDPEIILRVVRKYFSVLYYSHSSLLVRV